MQKIIIIFIIGILNIIVCSISYAAPNSNIVNNNNYQINMLVFTQITPQNLTSEYWPNILVQPYIKHTQEITPLPNFSLAKEATALQNKSQYKIIYQASWIQPIYNFAQAKWIHIQGGQAYDTQGNPLNNVNSTTSTNNATTTFKPSYWQLNGKIKISKNKFF